MCVFFLDNPSLIPRAPVSLPFFFDRRRDRPVGVVLRDDGWRRLAEFGDFAAAAAAAAAEEEEEEEVVAEAIGAASGYRRSAGRAPVSC